MLLCGKDGYTININQVQLGTSTKFNKMLSSMLSAKSFYAYRLMVRSKENYKQLLHRYLVDMYAKIEEERLLFIRLNQRKLRIDEYIHLKDAIVNDTDPAIRGKLVILPSTFTDVHETSTNMLIYIIYNLQRNYKAQFAYIKYTV